MTPSVALVSLGAVLASAVLLGVEVWVVAIVGLGYLASRPALGTTAIAGVASVLALSAIAYVAAVLALGWLATP